MDPNASGVSRRTVLRAGALGAAGLALTQLVGCSSKGSPTTAELGGGRPFVEPPVLRSTGGSLDVVLAAGALTVPMGSRRRWAMAYNGSTPGPTIRVRPGDRLRVTLQNDLTEPTNLHTHGLHISPDGSSDNIFVMIEPGRSHDDVYEIPADHPSGLFWYHPHHHGYVAGQVMAGLAGAIVVSDAIDDALDASGVVERVMVIADPRITTSSDTSAGSSMQIMTGREGDVVTINGAVRPVISSPSGAMERWKVLNASPSRYYRLAVDGHRLRVLTTDAGRFGRTAEVSEVVLAPGERVEFIVGPTAAGSYAVRSLPYDRGRMGMATRSASSSGAELATLVVSAAGTDSPRLPATLGQAPGLAGVAVSGSREFVLAMGMGGGGIGGGGMGGGGMGGGGFTINGKTFDPARIDTGVSLGAVEEWTISNSSPMDHPFHLHVWPMQEIARSNNSPSPGWKDTVNVPAGGWVKVRIRFGDFPGTAVYHCHILDHEDQGMMGIIRVT